MFVAYSPVMSTNETELAATSDEQARKATRWAVLLLCVAAVITLIPLWEPLLLAAFVAMVAEPLYLRLYRKTDGRASSAAVLTLLLAVFALIPLVIAGLAIYDGALDLFMRLRNSSGGSDALRRLVAADSGSTGSREWSASRLIDLARQHGWTALVTARTIFGAATNVVVGMFVFAVGFYTFLIQGRRAWAWLLKRSPLPRPYGVRFGDAFVETGRGLLVGVGLTAIIQGAIATIGYFAIGVSQAAVLGVMTALAALIPSVGTGLVWVPVAAGLFLAGRTRAGVILLVIGAGVSVIDNLIRPWLSRFGRLDLSAFLLLTAMLGGMSAFGGFGLLLGPLLVRLAMEGLRLLHDEQLDAPHRNPSENVSEQEKVERPGPEREVASERRISATGT